MMFSKFKAFIFSLKTKNKNKPKLMNNVVIRGNPKIKIGKNVKLYSNIIIWGDGELEIGNNVSIGDNVIIHTSKGGGIYIGNDSMIAANCYLINSNHMFKKNILIRKQGEIIKSIIIKDDCWIGANCSVLAGCVLHSHTIVGANSVINKNYEMENIVLAGVPARIIKYIKEDDYEE